LNGGPVIVDDRVVHLASARRLAEERKALLVLAASEPRDKMISAY
jgi:hypothetical protein